MSSDSDRRGRAKTNKRRFTGALQNGSSDECGGPMVKTRKNQRGNELPKDTKKTRDKGDEMAAAGSSCNVQHDKTMQDHTTGPIPFNGTDRESAGSQQYARSSQPLESPEIAANERDVGRNPGSGEENSKTNRESSDHCPICLASFTSQEIGTPSSCNHFFCLKCITEWANNTNTCPVDRQHFGTIIVREHYGGKVTNNQAVSAMRYQRYSPDQASRISGSDYDAHIWAEYISDLESSYESDYLSFLSDDNDFAVAMNENEDTEGYPDSMHDDYEDDASQHSHLQRDDQDAQQSSASSARDSGDGREESLSSHETDEISPNAEIDCPVTEASCSPYYDRNESNEFSHHVEEQYTPPSSVSSNDSEGGYYYSGYSQSGEDSGPPSVSQILEGLIDPSDSSELSGSSNSSAVSDPYSASSTDYSF